MARLPSAIAFSLQLEAAQPAAIGVKGHHHTPGFLHPVDLEADRNGAQRFHLQALLQHAFSEMGAGRLELPQSCNLRILSPLRLPIPPCPRVTAMAPFRSGMAATLGPHQEAARRSQAKSWIAPRPLRRRKRGWSGSSRLHHHLPSVKLAGPALLVRGNCRLMPCHCSTT